MMNNIYCLQLKLESLISCLKTIEKLRDNLEEKENHFDDADD